MTVLVIYRINPEIPGLVVKYPNLVYKRPTLTKGKFTFCTFRFCPRLRVGIPYPKCGKIPKTVVFYRKVVIF